MSKRKVSVSARAIAALLPFVSKEPNRYYLHGIQAEPAPGGGVLLIATDGHTIGVVHDAFAYADAEHILSIPSALAKATKARYGLCGTLHFLGNVVHVVSEEFPTTQNPAIISPHHIYSGHAPDIDGAFPNWRAIFHFSEQRTHDGAPTSFNAALVQRFHTAGQALLGRTIAEMSIYAPEDGGPALVRLPSGPDTGLAFVGLVMPMRSSMTLADSTLQPDWIARPKPITPAKGKRAKPAPRPAANKAA